MTRESEIESYDVLRKRLFYNLGGDTITNGLAVEDLETFSSYKDFDRIDEKYAIRTPERIFFTKVTLKRKILMLIYNITVHFNYIEEAVKDLPSSTHDDTMLIINRSEFPDDKILEESVSFLRKFLLVFDDNNILKISRYVFISALDNVLKKDRLVNKLINRSIYRKIDYHLVHSLSKHTIKISDKTKKIEEELNTANIILVDVKEISNPDFVVPKKRAKKPTKGVCLTEFGFEFCNRLFNTNSPYMKLFEVCDLYEQEKYKFEDLIKEINDLNRIINNYMLLTDVKCDEINSSILNYFGEAILEDVLKLLIDNQKTIALEERINSAVRGNKEAKEFAQRFFANLKKMMIFYTLNKNLRAIMKNLKKLKRTIQNHEKYFAGKHLELINSINPMVIEKIILAKKEYDKKIKDIEEIQEELEQLNIRAKNYERQTFEYQTEILKIFG